LAKESGELIEEDDIEASKNMVRYFFDECYNPTRFSNYDSWRDIGFGLKHVFGEEGYELYDYGSKKDTSGGYRPEDNKKRLRTIGKANKPIIMGTLCYYAKKDNPIKFWSIIKKYSSSLKISHDDIANYLHKLYFTKFLWVKGKLKCFNGSHWEEDNLDMQRTIVNDLYHHIFQVEMAKILNIEQQIAQAKAGYSEAKYLEGKKVDIEKLIKIPDKFGNTALDKLHDQFFIDGVIRASRKYFTNDEIQFDNKWHILPFND
jgi:hypothetical protein